MKATLIFSVMLMLIACDNSSPQKNMPCIERKPVGDNMWEQNGQVCKRSKGVMCLPKCQNYKEGY